MCNSRIFNLSGSFGKFSAAVNILIFRKEIYTEFKISNDEGKKMASKTVFEGNNDFFCKCCPCQDL